MKKWVGQCVQNHGSINHAFCTDGWEVCNSGYDQGLKNVPPTNKSQLFDYLEWTQLFSRSKTSQKTHDYVIVTKVKAKKNPQYVANQSDSVFDL